MRKLAQYLNGLGDSGRSDLASIRAAVIAETALSGTVPRSGAALDRLASQLRRSPRSEAAAWSDLAAGDLVAAQRLDDPLLLFSALAAADRALTMDDRNAEACFNRALLLEYLAWDDPARKAWRACLMIETDPGWAGEIRRRLARLDHEAAEIKTREQATERLAAAAVAGEVGAATELAHIAPERTRRLVQDELLPRWGQAGQTGDMASADRLLATTKTIVAALRQLDHDALLTEALAAIDGAAGEPRRLAALRRGHVAFGEGMTLYRGRKHLKQAAQHFATAQTLLEGNQSPFAEWAATYRAICEHSSPQPDESTVRHLEALASGANLSRCPALAGRVFWQLGLGDLIHDERERAIKRFERAALAFQQAGDRESQAAIADLAASAYDFLGDAKRSGNYRYLCLRSLPWVRSARRRWVIMKTTAESLLARGDPSIALPVLNELVRMSGDDAESRAQALLRRGVAFRQLGDHQRAARDAEDAKAAAMRIADDELRERVQVDVLVAQVAVALPANPDRALHLLEEPLRFYRQAHNELLLARVLLARARAALAGGREAEAELDLTEALRRSEREWRGLTDESLKTSFLGELQATFDDLLMAQLKHGDPAAAFATAERARGRVLLARSSIEPLTAREVQAELPTGTFLVEYAFLGDRLLIWTLSSGGGFALDAVDWAGIGGPALLAEGWKREEVLRGQLAKLYEALIGPIARRLPAGAPLVLVPQGAISAVPFSALLNRESGRYLIEDHPLIVAPSASFHVAAKHRAYALRAGISSLLALGDSAFSQNLHFRLERLPAARAEVAAIANLYEPHDTVLIGERATAESLRGALPGHDVIHFAVHAVINSLEPERSALVLTPSNSDASSGDLSAAAIERLALEKTRLVVLATCSSAAGPVVKGEGTLSLARAFLAAGTPTVVAGFWPVKDRFGYDFFTLFHTRLRQGDSPAEALRQTQLHLLHNSREPERRSPLAWGAFQVYGASVGMREVQAAQRPPR